MREVPTFATLDDVDTGLAEAARYLRLRLTRALDNATGSDGGRTILLTSPRATAAVGATAILVAAAISELGDRVAIVMTNFASSPGAEPGLGEVLDGKTLLRDALRYRDGGGLGIIEAGCTESASIVALGGDRMKAVIGQLADEFDYVIVVGGPVLESADSLQLAGAADAGVLVCPIPPVTAAEISESERLLSLSPTTLVGRVTVVGNDRDAATLSVVGAGTQDG
jgi:Mrp family chromosome partitioning ATPase